MKTYSLMIHGGAGAIFEPDKYRPSMQAILAEGEKALQAGKSALDVVELCARLLEDDPLYNAGKGSVLNANGEVEMDAGIMDGRTISAGAVAAVRLVRNPISLARKVMEQTEHVLLATEGALAFARLVGEPLEPSAYFETEARRQQLINAQKTEAVVLDHSVIQEKKFGTIGAVAQDKEGNLAAATSTGGLTNKKFGRVGDTPLVGAGVFADNETCAVSTTGIGEQMMRTVLAKTISDLMAYKGLDAEQAAKQGIATFVRRVNGIGGAIVIDKNGNCFGAYSSPSMLYGWVKEGEPITLGF